MKNADGDTENGTALIADWKVNQGSYCGKTYGISQNIKNSVIIGSAIVISG